MKGAPRRHQGRSALDLIEEAVHLLRTAPAAALAAYYVGTLPFVLGVLYFWADMSRNPFARRHVVEAALGVALLFFWMKFCHAVFARRLHAHLGSGTPAPLGFKRALHLALTQAAVQPTGLFLLPLAAILALPFPWVYAFYQNVTALGDGNHTGTRDLIRKAVRQSRLWAGQNNLALAFLLAFGGFVFLNCTITCAALPSLLKSALGIETVFSRGGMAMLNTTFFATMFGVTYLCVDPIFKSLYVLRCFYGDSVASGADLRAELRRYAAPAMQLATLWLVLLSLLGGTTLHAAETAPTPTPPATAQNVSPTELNRAIDEVIQQRKYTWRMPREQLAEDPEGEQGVIASFVNKVGRMVRDAIRATFKWLGSVIRETIDWIARMLGKLFGGRSVKPLSPNAPNMDWLLLSQILTYALVAAVLSTLVIVFFRMWKKRQPKPDALQTEAIQPVPDITDENVGADQLPEDGWTKMARELLARGEFRLALRAFYLASLAHLAERNLISLARFKSNHDYERELGRRAHALPTLQQLFEQNVVAFDRVWYGTDPASGELVNQFAANVERIKAGG